MNGTCDASTGKKTGPHWPARQLAIMESIGVVFIIVPGTCLHFVFEWSDHSKFVAVFGAVNESTWEHLKLAFWPALVWAVVEYLYFRLALPNPGFAKAFSVLTMMLVIITGAWGIDVVLGQHVLVVDVSLFVAAIVAGQWISFRLMLHSTPLPRRDLFGFAVLLLLAIAFAIFTFFPPEISLFQDPVTSSYGIPEQ